MIKIKKGLDIPIAGAPQRHVEDAMDSQQFALLGDDYVGMKPTLEVQVGDQVKRGQLLFTEKKMPRIRYTAPAAGEVIEINRGAKRKFLSLVIRADETEQEIDFDAFEDSLLDHLDRQKVIDLLLESGAWTGLRARPMGKVADPDTEPHSIFVNAMDTQPLAPPMQAILEGREKEFKAGLKVLSALTKGPLYLCKDPETSVPTIDSDRLRVEEFSGPHPAGLSGTHIHFLDPVSRKKIVWSIQAQDVIAFGGLFLTGKIFVERILSLAGPIVKNPRLLRTRLGAQITPILKDEINDPKVRIISGSVLNGHIAEGPVDYLGKYHQQITVLYEGREREFLGWLTPGMNLFSVKKILASSLFPQKKFAFSTALHGGPRAIVPNTSYDSVMPLDILPTPLLRALAITDVEESEFLGCLELVEEDLALCTYVCPSKIDHTENLRKTLTLIEKEG
ncbi:Na(+)-translocating NADH-quinone reductase subunit A [candidate division KSB1 bacterium]|nr:Na(+)-translocating NADH-quinone reductase subunit A [candidate division KSB1 bacterium]